MDPLRRKTEQGVSMGTRSKIERIFNSGIQRAHPYVGRLSGGGVPHGKMGGDTVRRLVIYESEAYPWAGGALRYTGVRRDVSAEGAIRLVIPRTRPCLADTRSALHCDPYRIAGRRACEGKGGARWLSVARAGYGGVPVHVSHVR